MIRVTIGGAAWNAATLGELSDECHAAMAACYASGAKPTIAEIGPAANAAKLAEIRETHAALAAVGVNVPTGGLMRGRLTGETYATQEVVAYTTTAIERRRKAHLDARPCGDVAGELIATIVAEKRENLLMSAGEFARGLEANGKISVQGRALTEHALRGLASRLDSPMFPYLRGVRDRMLETHAAARAAELLPDHPDHAAARAAAPELRAFIASDRALVADTIVRECRRNPDAPLMLRTRGAGLHDVFAILSPGYGCADAPEVLPGILDGLPSDAKGIMRYDAATTAWELRANVWTPNASDTLAVGEPFSGFLSLRGRDNGTGKVGGAGGCEMLSCLNSAVATAEGARANRVHRKGVLHDVRAMLRGARDAIGVLCQAWGRARAAEIPMTPEERAEGDKFLAEVLRGAMRSRELVGILPGRADTHVPGLLAAYHSERRDADRLVRSDLAQAWTRYVQGQPEGVQFDAEAAIGRWVVASPRAPRRLDGGIS